MNAQQSIRKRKRPELPDRATPWCARIPKGAIWAGQGDVCVWPPIVIGDEDVDSNVLIQARRVIKDVGFGEGEFATIHIGRGSVQKLLVFEPTAKCYLAARVLGEVCNQEVYKHATVNDMTSIDPHKELVQWIPLTNNIERDLNPNAARAKGAQEKIVQVQFLFFSRVFLLSEYSKSRPVLWFQLEVPDNLEVDLTKLKITNKFSLCLSSGN